MRWGELKTSTPHTHRPNPRRPRSPPTRPSLDRSSSQACRYPQPRQPLGDAIGAPSPVPTCGEVSQHPRTPRDPLQLYRDPYSGLLWCRHETQAAGQGPRQPRAVHGAPRPVLEQRPATTPALNQHGPPTVCARTGPEPDPRRENRPETSRAPPNANQGGSPGGEAARRGPAPGSAQRPLTRALEPWSPASLLQELGLPRGSTEASGHGQTDTPTAPSGGAPDPRTGSGPAGTRARCQAGFPLPRRPATPLPHLGRNSPDVGPRLPRLRALVFQKELRN